MFPSASPSALSVASAFCATYTTKKNTATTGFPTRATSACGINTSLYSSACSCKPTYSSTLTTTTATPTPTCAPTPSNNIVKNGGFECGLASWTATDTYNNKHYVRGPGDNSANAYEFNQFGDPKIYDPDYTYRAASLTQNLTVTVGKNYVLKFRAWFDKCTIYEGFVGVQLNDGDDESRTVDSCDDFPARVQQFGDYTIPFTASRNPENLKFEFVIGEPDAVIKLDNIMVVPA